MRRAAVAIVFPLAVAALAAAAWLLLRDPASPNGGAGRTGRDRTIAAPEVAPSGDGAPRADAPSRTGEPTPAHGGVDGGPGALAGRVETIAGAPIEGARVELYGDDFTRELAHAASSADGAFRFDGLAPMGTAGVVARKDGFVTGVAREEADAVRAGQVTTLAPLRLEAAAIVRGRTLDGERRPLAGVSVSITHFNDPPVESDDEGRFTLRRVPPRRTYVGARKAGWIARHTYGFDIVPKPGEDNPEIEFVFVRAGRLRGTVRTRSGAPFPDCMVQARVEQPFRRASGETLERCSSDGSYQIDDLPAGGSGYARPESPWLVDVEEKPIVVDGDPVDFVVEPWPLLRFDVVDAVSGARVTPTQIDLRVVDPDAQRAPASGPVPARTRFDEAWQESSWNPAERSDDAGWPVHVSSSGLFELPFGRVLKQLSASRPPTASDPWPCVAFVAAPGYCDAIVVFEVTEPATLPTLRVALAPGLAVVGRVFDADGAPLTGARLSLLADQPDDARGWSVWHGILVPDDFDFIGYGASDAAGSFRLDVERHPGRPVRLRVRAPGRALGEGEPFELAPQGVTKADVRLARGGALEGRVTRAGSPAKDTRIVAFRDDGVAAAERCEKDGGYRFAMLPAGRWRVRLGAGEQVMEHAMGASRAGAPRRPSAEADVEVVAGATARLDLDVDAPPGQGIFGVVRTAPDDTAMTLVDASRTGEVAGDLDGAAPSVLLDRDGTFRLSDLAPGRWRVRARDASRLEPSVHADVVVEAGRWTRVELDFVRRRLRGCVVDRRTAKPLQIVSLLSRADAETTPSGALPGFPGASDPDSEMFETGGDGGFAFDHLLAAEYVARFPRYARAGRGRELRIDLREHDVPDLRVELDARSSLTIDLPELIRSGGELQSIALESAAGTTVTPTSDDGRRRVYDEVDPGPCTLRLEFLGSDGVRRTERLEIDVVPCTDFYANPFVTHFLATREKR